RMLGPAGNVLPSGIPIQEINVLDANGNLKVDAFTNLLPADALKLLPGDSLQKVLTAIASVIDQLPDNFKQYLNITIPQNLSFSVSASPEGTIRLDVNGDPQHPLKVMYPTIAFMPPYPVPMPVLYGIQLNSLSFGPLSGGSLFQLQVDAIIDQFDLV